MAATKYRAIYEVTTSGRDEFSGQAVVNIFHYRGRKQAVEVLLPNDDIPGSTIDAALLTFRLLWREYILTILSDHYFVDEYKMRHIVGWSQLGADPQLITYGSQAILTGDLAGLDTGQRPAGEALPCFAAVSVPKKTDLPGRNFRGGSRLGPIPEGDNNNGRLTAAYLAIAEAATGNFALGLLNNGSADPDAKFLKFVVASRTLILNGPEIIINTDPLAGDVISYHPSRNLGTQNSRKSKASDIISLT